jgi:hypothetical protein
MYTEDQLVDIRNTLGRNLADKYTDFGLIPPSTFEENELDDYATPMFRSEDVLLIMVAGDFLYPTEVTPEAGWVVSEGTLKTDDLIYAFESWLTANGYHVRLSYVWTPPSCRTEELEAFYLEELIGVMDDIADEAELVFGPHLGDGALLGFWNEASFLEA